MSKPVLEGACFCEAVGFTVTGTPRSTVFCHCRSCQRASGAPLVAWASFKKSDFAVTRGALASYASSPGVSRGFCGRCGTPLTYVHAERGDEIDITVVSLRDPGALTPVKHLYTEHKLPWVRVDDGLPQFPRFTADGGVT